MMYPKLLFFAIWTSVASGWAVLVSHRASTLPPVLKTKVGRFARQAAAATASDGDTETATYRTVLDFANSSTIDKVERLDDAIMGGISTSTVRADKGENFARWSGVCRTDGGGFCGFRTNPFAEPLMVGSADGFYVMCRLTSDNEPERRVWKMTTRTKPDRGELLYQAPFDFTSTSSNWTTVKVPFASFKYVRGPRMIPDGPPLNTTAGLYQIGMTMSKFVFGVNTTEISNFRDGFFELQLKEIGLYKEREDSTIGTVVTPKVYSKLEAKKQRSLILKVLIPVSKIFFSEQSQRRKSAMRILTKERKLTRIQAILWGLKNRSKNYGVIRSMAKTVSILAIDTFRTLVLTVLKICLVYPIRLARNSALLLKRKKATRAAE